MKRVLITIIAIFAIATLFSQSTNVGELKIEEGTSLYFTDIYTSNTGAIVTNNGEITFNNTFINNGTLSITDNSTTTINGDFNNTDIIEVEINGGVAGDSLGYSQIIVNSNLTVLGTINVSIDPTYLPVDGTIHTVITYTGSLTGTFDTINIISTSGWYLDTSTSGQINIIRDSVLDIESIEKTDFVVYPNPVSNYININSTIEIDNVELYDLLGKQILSTNQTSEINVSHLPVGIYLLKVFSKNGNSTKKIMIE